MGKLHQWKEDGPFTEENIPLYDKVKWGPTQPIPELGGLRAVVLVIEDSAGEEPPFRAVLGTDLVLAIARDIIHELGQFGELN